MTKETKISIGIVIIGLIAMIAYWFMPQGKETHTLQASSLEERIILPLYEKSIYQNIPEVQSYIADVKQMIQNGKAVLSLQSNELDSNA